MENYKRICGVSKPKLCFYKKTPGVCVLDGENRLAQDNRATIGVSGNRQCLMDPKLTTI